jgi:hypothetical protein
MDASPDTARMATECRCSDEDCDGEDKIGFRSGKARDLNSDAPVPPEH